MGPKTTADDSVIDSVSRAKSRDVTLRTAEF
jgi:hypothetical protein